MFRLKNEIASGVILPDPNQQMLEMEQGAMAGGPEQDQMLQGQEDPAALPPAQAPNPQEAQEPSVKDRARSDK